MAIDARMMGPLVTRGIGRYIEELVHAMIARAPHHQFILLTRNPEISPFLGHANVEHIKADVPWYSLAEQIKMPALLRQARADLVHIPHWNVPLLFRGPFVITIHDLLLLHQPTSAKVSTRGPIIRSIKHAAYRFDLARAMKRARQILVPTEWVAKDLQTFFPEVQKRIKVTGEGLTDFPAADPSIFKRYTLDAKRYLLYVGSAYPHKRLDLLLDAWRVIAERHPELSLIMAGEEDVFMARMVARVKQENLPRVTFTGRVTDAELAVLLSQARAFVFPSSYEGFGLPPLEALSFGCPVISSDATCLPEVLPREGVFFFRNGDANDMIRAMEHALNTPPPSSVISDRYRWSEVARLTLESYERAAFHSFHG